MKLGLEAHNNLLLLLQKIKLMDSYKFL